MDLLCYKLTITFSEQQQRLFEASGGLETSENELFKPYLYLLEGLSALILVETEEKVDSSRGGREVGLEEMAEECETPEQERYNRLFSVYVKKYL